MNPRDTKPEDLDPDRRKGSTLPVTPKKLVVGKADAPSISMMQPAKTPSGLPWRTFLSCLVASAILAAVGTSKFYRDEINSLNIKWQQASEVATGGNQTKLNSLTKELAAARDAEQKAASDLAIAKEGLVTAKKAIDAAKSDAKTTNDAKAKAEKDLASAKATISEISEAVKKKGNFDRDSDKVVATEKVREILGK